MAPAAERVSLRRLGARGHNVWLVALLICIVKYFSWRRPQRTLQKPFSPPWKEAMKSENTASRSTAGIVLAPALLLLLPLVAMQFTQEVVWTPADFAVAGALLVGTSLLFVLATRKAGSIAHRAAFGLALVAALLLVWLNLAVGIIGSEGNPANLMYAGVLAVGFIGALIARFQPKGMARAMFATALAQGVVAMIARSASVQPANMRSVAGITLLHGIFVALFAASAFLFQRAATQARPARMPRR